MGPNRLIAILAALALVLSGCVSIPRDGGIGRITVGDGESGVQSRIDPDGPVPGAGPDEIVRGFLAAGAGYSNNFEVARSFLTESFAADWDPRSVVRIMPSGTGLEELTSEITADSQTVSFDLPLQASLDDRRVYRESVEDTVVEMEFALRQVNGEWRIAQAPPGLVVSSSNFSTLFQAYPVYFYTPDFAYLVPDTRWFIRSPATSTEALTEMLRGPADHLAGATVSAVPEGTRLDPQVVAVSEGLAEVGLSETADGLDAVGQARLVHQIGQTLREITSLTEVEVDVPSGLLDPESEDAAPTVVPIDARPIAVSDDRLVRVVGSGVESIEGSPELSAEDAAPAIALDESMYAYRSEDRTALHRVLADSMADAVVLTGDELVGPSFDRFGWTWTAEADSDGTLQAVDRAGELAALDTPFLTDRRVEAVHVSRNGAQLGVLSSDTEGRSRIEVIGITRDGSGRPTGTVQSAPLVVGAGFDSIADFSWSGPQTLVMLASPATGAPKTPYSSPVGGPYSLLGAIDRGVAITSGGDGGSIRVSTADGELYTYSAGSWQNLVDVRVSDPAYPG